MVKRLNALIPDELHKRLRLALVANETDFSTWVRAHIEKYVEEAEKKELSDFVGKMTPEMFMRAVEKSRKLAEGKSRKTKSPRGGKEA